MQRTKSSLIAIMVATAAITFQFKLRNWVDIQSGRQLLERLRTGSSDSLDADQYRRVLKDLERIACRGSGRPQSQAAHLIRRLLELHPAST